MLNARSVLQPHPQVIDTPLEAGELALLRVDTQRFFRLNATGAWIWSRLAEGAALGDIAEGLAARYDLGDADPLAEAVELAESLLAEGLVEERG